MKLLPQLKNIYLFKHFFPQLGNPLSCQNRKATLNIGFKNIEVRLGGPLSGVTSQKAHHWAFHLFYCYTLRNHSFTTVTDPQLQYLNHLKTNIVRLNLCWSINSEMALIKWFPFISVYFLTFLRLHTCGSKCRRYNYRLGNVICTDLLSSGVPFVDLGWFRFGVICGLNVT